MLPQKKENIRYDFFSLILFSQVSLHQIQCDFQLCRFADTNLQSYLCILDIFLCKSYVKPQMTREFIEMLIFSLSMSSFSQIAWVC